MPPAAVLIYHSSSIEEMTLEMDTLGIEVEALEHCADESSSILATRILISDESGFERDNTLTIVGLDDQGALQCDTDNGPERYDLRNAGNAEGRSLMDSSDSFDEIAEGSNESKLIRSLAANARLASSPPSNIEASLALDPNGINLGTQDLFFLDEADAHLYLDVFDQHVEETDAECFAFSELDSSPDDPHPNKHEAKVADILGHLLDEACCECTAYSKPLKSVLRPSKWKGGENSLSTIPGVAVLRSPSVGFKDVDIREFKMTLGNHPSATSGPPVMLDWDSRPDPHIVNLETYEMARQPRRNRRQLKLTLQERHGILVRQQGFSFDEVKAAWQDALEVRKQRKETLERGLALMKWDEVWESTCRKFNRLVDGAL
jgi:hypothetical protein